MRRSLIALAVAAMLSSTSVSAAVPAPASRDAAPANEASEMGSSIALVAAIVVAVGVLFFVILDDDDDDDPASP